MTLNNSCERISFWGNYHAGISHESAFNVITKISGHLYGGQLAAGNIRESFHATAPKYKSTYVLKQAFSSMLSNILHQSHFT